MRTVRIIVASFIAFAVLGALAFEYVLPAVIEREVRTRLPAGAHFEVGTIALDRVELLDVSLARGLELGDVTIEAGPWQLWRGEPPDLVLAGPRIDTRALATRPGSGGGTPRVGRVTIVDGKLDEIAVSGTIDLGGSVDLVARAPRLRIGPVVARDVAATVRGPLRELRACATGTLDAGVQLDACATLDARTRARAQLVWQAHGRAGSAHGTARLVRAGDAFAIEDGTLEAVVAAHTTHGITVERASLRATLAGPLDELVLRGELRAGRLAAEQVSLRDAVLPFELAGSPARLRSHQPLVLAAASATVTAAGRSLRVDTPTITARGALGRIALGGDAPLRVAVKLRGVSVDHVLAAASRDRIRGTGVFDGELVFDDSFALVGGGLAARAPGRLRVKALAGITDPDVALHHRVAAALADFNYARLAVSVAGDPELKLTVQGRGRRVPQAIAIDVNVRGLLARTERTR